MNMKTTLATSAIALFVVTSASADEWTGFYAGANIGYASSTLSIDGTEVLEDVEESFSDSIDSDEGIFGLKIGYDYQINSQFVVGGFASYSQFNAEEEGGSVDIGYFDLGAKFGYVVSPTMLAYISAGYTQLGVQELSDAGYNPNGYNVGLGVDYKLTENWILNADYTFRSVSESERIEDVDADASLDTGAFTVGVAYKF